MLMNKIRENTHIILWILIFGFLATIVFSWGMDITGSKNSQRSGIIGSINGSDVSYENFINMVRNQYMMYKNQYDIDLNESQMRQLRQMVWNQLVNTTLQEKEINEKDIVVSDNEIVREIQTNPPMELRTHPRFQTDGQFDPQKYIEALQNPNINWSNIEQMVRQNLPFRKLQNRIIATARVTNNEIRNKYLEENITAKAEYIFIPISKISDSEITVTNAELEEYYTKNKENFKEPAKAKLRYVFFSTAPTKEDTSMVYNEFNEAREQIKNGEAFDSVAVEYSDDPSVDLGYIGKDQTVDEFEKAAFGANIGKLVGPVKTTQGIHLIKVTDKKYGKDEETGKTVVDSARVKHILFRFEASQNTIDNATYDANNFSIIAQEEGFIKTAKQDTLKVRETPYISEDSFIPQLGAVGDLSYFGLNYDIGAISNPIDVQNGIVVAEILDKIEERYRTLEEVKDEIENTIRTKKKKERIKELAYSIYAQIESGKSLTEVTKENNLTIESTNEFKIGDYITGVGSDVKFTSTAVYQNENEISKPIEGARGYYIIKTIEKSDFDEEIFNAKKEELKQKILREKQNRVIQAWLNNLRNNADIKDYRRDYFR